MECCVFEPSGTYEVTFRYRHNSKKDVAATTSEDAGTILLTVAPRQVARATAAVPASPPREAPALPSLEKDTADSRHEYHRSHSQQQQQQQQATDAKRSVCYEACLQQAEVHQITCQAGVRKSVAAFADMLHAALVGTRQQKQHLFFSIETVSQLRSRITDEMRQQQQQPPSTAAANLSLLELSLQSEDGVKVEDLLKQMVFVLDYRVDFTRALFTIPLQAQEMMEEGEREEEEAVAALAHAAATAATGRVRAKLSVEGGNTNKNTIKREKVKSEEDDDGEEDDLLLLAQMKQKLEEAHLTIHHLSKENKNLKKENEALVRLSREKMLEMQNVCNDFARKAEDFAQIDHLKKKNAEMRVKIEKLERLVAEQPQPYRHRRHGTASEDDTDPSLLSPARPRRRPPQDREGTRSPSVRSRQGSADRATTAARGSGREQGHHYQYQQQAQQQLRRRSSGGRRPSPLLSPPLTPVADRRRAKEGAYRGRFDTPPPSARQSQQKLSRAPSTSSAASQRRSGSCGSAREYHYGPTTTNAFKGEEKQHVQQRKSQERTGGDSPAPRGRSGNRPAAAAAATAAAVAVAKWTRKDAATVKKGKNRDDERASEDDRFMEEGECEEDDDVSVRQKVKQRFASPALGAQKAQRTQKRAGSTGSNHHNHNYKHHNDSYHGSSCSSRASSSCERLYQTPTASSRQREAEVYRPEVGSRRAVFR